MVAALESIKSHQHHNEIYTTLEVKSSGNEADYLLQCGRSGSGEHQNGYHERHKRARRPPNRPAQAAQVPRTRSEAIADKEHTDENGDRKGDIGCDSSDGEKGACGDWASKDERAQSNGDTGVEPHGVDWSPGALVHTLDPG